MKPRLLIRSLSLETIFGTINVYSYGFCVALALLSCFLVCTRELERLKIPAEDSMFMLFFIPGFWFGSKAQMFASAAMFGGEWPSMNFNTGSYLLTLSMEYVAAPTTGRGGTVIRRLVSNSDIRSSFFKSQSCRSHIPKTQQQTVTDVTTPLVMYVMRIVVRVKGFVCRGLGFHHARSGSRWSWSWFCRVSFGIS